MLQALNRTLHTPYVNATLSAFDNNWCEQRRCTIISYPRCGCLANQM